MSDSTNRVLVGQRLFVWALVVQINIALLAPFSNKYPLQRDIFCWRSFALCMALWAYCGALLLGLPLAWLGG
jgi:hypothetical protein